MLHDIGFVPTRANSHLWPHPAEKVDGFKYYELLLCYTDDLLAISEMVMIVLDSVKMSPNLKMKNQYTLVSNLIP